MVVDGGGGWGSDWCNEKCTPQGCPGVEYFPCDLVDTVTECDQTLGAGTVFPAGGYAANKPCGVADGRRFLTLAGRVRETKWWIKDGKRCEGSVATASTVCMKIYREAEVHRACVDGEITCNWLLTSFVPGDVDGLAK